MNNNKVGNLTFSPVKYQTPIIDLKGIGYAIQGSDGLFRRGRDAKGTDVPLSDRRYIEVFIRTSEDKKGITTTTFTSIDLNRKFLESLIFNGIVDKVVIKFLKIRVFQGVVYAEESPVKLEGTVKSTVLKWQSAPCRKAGKIITIRYHKEKERPYTINFEEEEVTIPKFLQKCRN